MPEYRIRSGPVF